LRTFHGSLQGLEALSCIGWPPLGAFIKPPALRVVHDLVASFTDQPNLLKREENVHAYAARPSLECTSKACGAQAYSLLHAAAAYRVFF
jgi:hypothetical protein